MPSLMSDLMLAEPCAYCDAEPGEWCRTISGRRVTYLHSARWYAARPKFIAIADREAENETDAE